ncbi:hypothetical protein SAMN05216389_103139 [Oceanobacillus limi]|uniref:Uncharacterized protein n=1 Tax=Oceanobacillus limi TaxID=930131 RepID=A0A1I0AB04_9BACI|nr:hypothetical protein [Oceanobacillus limi]SES90864.1 hypothetical protein SAMN05216389_103139 [Oceanobacillus limi]
MQELAKKLQPFIPGNPSIKIVEDEYTTEVIDTHTKEVYGTVHINDGRFEGYDMEVDYDEEQEQTYNTPADVAKMLHTAALFVDTFIDREVHFSMLNEWSENNFMVTYEERDPKLGLLLPHTGCTLSFTRDGVLTTANIGQTDVELEYPTIKISDEEAKELLRKSDYLQLAIHFPDEGAEELELIYHTSHDIMGVGIDGRIETVSEFMDAEDLPAQRIPKVTPTETIEQMLGIPNSLIKKDGEEGSVIWVDPNAILDEDEEEEAVISIFDDNINHFSYCNLPFYQTENLTELPMEALMERALQFLELVVKNSNEKYVLEDPYQATEDGDEEIEDLDEFEDIDSEEDMDAFPDPEPTQMFTFYREHAGLRLEGFEAHIHVGLYTGIIRECSVTGLSDKQYQSLQNINTTPTISMEKAEQRIFAELEMKLARTVKYFDNPKIYTLSYTPEFPKTGGHIEKMNAHTGEISYVDTGILKEED